MIGRRVESRWHRRSGTVVRWEPLGSGLCDTLIEHGDGSLCWYGSSDLTPIDGEGPLPSRREAIETAHKLQAAQLLRIAALWER